MKMGDIATTLGRIRLDDMRDFRGTVVNKDVLWKLLFSYSVNEAGDNDAPAWAETLFLAITEYKEPLPNTKYLNMKALNPWQYDREKTK